MIAYLESRVDNDPVKTAADVVRTARSRRRLTMKELAGVSGVSAATISRIESGQVDPAYGTVMRLLRALGYRAEGDLVQQANDDAIVAAIRSEPSVADRFDVYRVAAQVSPVTARSGVRAVAADLDKMVDLLEREGLGYAFSALEGFYGGWSERGPQSFWPVVYLGPEVEQFWPLQAAPGTRGTVYTLPMTPNASRFVDRANGISLMTPDWSIIDTIASPNRQSDVGLALLASLGEATRTDAA